MKLLLPFVSIIACLFFAFSAPVIATQDAVRIVREERQQKQASMISPGAICVVGQCEVIA